MLLTDQVMGQVTNQTMGQLTEAPAAGEVMGQVTEAPAVADTGFSRAYTWSTAISK
jgi:hypothetical protein